MTRRARDLFAGLGFIRRSPVFLAAMTLDLFGVLLGGAVALLPVYARDILLVGPTGLGVLRSAPALGALLMALVMAHRPPWERPGRGSEICEMMAASRSTYCDYPRIGKEAA